ncbi:MAG: EI24 domain-containing protein [bacterium]
MLTAAWKAVGILKDKECWRVLARGLLVTGAVFVVLGFVVWWVLAQVTVFDIGWLDKVFDLLGGLAVVVLTWLLFPTIATLVITFFLDGIVAVVESRHYPDSPAPRPQSLSEGWVIAVKLTSVTVLVNLLVLPFYLFSGIGVVASYVVNAYLLSREYFELVAVRRLDPKTTRRVRRNHRGRIFVAGLLITFLFTVPGVNLLAPVIAAAFMVHLFEGLCNADGNVTRFVQTA